MYLNPIDLKIFNFILNKINLCFPYKRKPKYSNEYYLERIIFILKSGCSLRESNNTKIVNHYSSIHKKFKLWTNKGFFNNLFNEFIMSYKRKLRNKITKHSRKSSILTLFIDSTNIRNKNGKQFIGRNYQDKFKNGNKITVICDENKIPLIININKANIHDAKILSTNESINKSLDKINKDIKLNKIILVGDKGYILNKTKKKLLLKRNIKLIYPYRKNQKSKNSKTNEEKLKKRPLVENLFATLKQFKKIQFRYENTILAYEGFVKIACLFIGYRFLFKNN